MKKQNDSKILLVDHAELVKVLMELKGATPATIEALTPVKLNKKDNPYFEKGIFKTQRSNVFINFNYTAAVNRQLVREGKEPNFVAQPRVWGVKLPGVPIICHNEKYYLEARFLGSDPHVEYWYEGKPIKLEQFEKWLPPRKSPDHQGVEKDIVLRAFDIKNIHSIVFKKAKYIVVDKEKEDKFL